MGRADWEPDRSIPGEQTPIAGQQYVATAVVRSQATQGVQHGTVYFYWADPTLSITTTNAHFIGASNVNVNAGQTNETQCTNFPWTPTLLSTGSGHECLVAAVVDQGGSPPSSLDASSDPTVAQHNLGVITMSSGQSRSLIYPFRIGNSAQEEQTFTIAAETGRLAEVEKFVRALVKKERILEEPGGFEQLGIVNRPFPTPEECKSARASIDNVSIGPWVGAGSVSSVRTRAVPRSSTSLSGSAVG